MRHRRHDRKGCPVEACTEVVGGKWKGKIISSSACRFGAAAENAAC